MNDLEARQRAGPSRVPMVSDLASGLSPDRRAPDAFDLAPEPTRISQPDWVNAPSPSQPAAERSGRLQMSTLKPDQGIGLLGETEEELKERRKREEQKEWTSAIGMIDSPKLRKDVDTGMMTFEQGLTRDADAKARQSQDAEDEATAAAGAKHEDYVKRYGEWQAGFKKTLAEGKEDVERYLGIRDAYLRRGYSIKDAIMYAKKGTLPSPADDRARKAAETKAAEEKAEAGDQRESIQKADFLTEQYQAGKVSGKQIMAAAMAGDAAAKITWNRLKGARTIEGWD